MLLILQILMQLNVFIAQFFHLLMRRVLFIIFPLVFGSDAIFHRLDIVKVSAVGVEHAVLFLKHTDMVVNWMRAFSVKGSRYLLLLLFSKEFVIFIR